MMGAMGKRCIMVSLASSAAVVALLGFDASALAAQKIRVMFQGPAPTVQGYQAAARKFMAANPDIEVEMMYVPHDSYSQKFGSMVMAKDLPDIMEFDAPFLANYAWSGYLRPLEGLLDKALLDDMTPSNVAQGTYPIDGKLYGIGLTDSSVVLYGNRKYLEAVGARIPTKVEDAWTQAEFMDVMEKLSKLPNVKWPIDLFRGYGAKSEWVPYAFSPILQSAGCDLIDRKTWKAAGTLDSDACVKAAGFLQTIVDKGWVVPASSGTNQFYIGDKATALAWGGFWYFGDIVNANTLKPDEVVVMPLPKFGDKGVSPNGTWIWGVMASSKAPEAAGKFLTFLLNNDDNRTAQRAQSNFPGLKSFAAESPLYVEGGPMHIAVEQAGKTATTRPPHPAYPTITAAFQTAMDKIFNKTPPKKALAEAAKKIDQDIEDNKGYSPFDKMAK